MAVPYKYIFLLVCAIGFQWSSAQQTPVFTEYNYNPFIINSAYAGAAQSPEATLSNIGFGSQKFEGSPRSFSLTFDTSLRNDHVGLGAGVINDQIGVTKATQVFAAYSYKIFLNDNVHPYWKIYDRTVLSFGLSAGMLSYHEDLLSLGIQDDPNFSENVNATLPSAGLGVMFGHGNFFSGISMPNILGDTFSNQNNLNLTRPVYGYVGYHFFLNRFQPDFFLKPSLLLKYEKGAPMQLDTNLSFSYKSLLELGAGYRSSSSFNVFAGINPIKNFRIMYSYTQGRSDSPLANTHGIILGYRAGKGFAAQ